MNSQRMRYMHGAVELNGILAVPQSSSGKLPGILVAHSAHGLTSGIEQRVQMLAGLGYVALAADLYGGEHPKSGPAISDAMMALRADHSLLRARIRSALEALRARPEVDGSRIAAIGYCFGGMAVLELARDGAALAGVSAITDF